VIRFQARRLLEKCYRAFQKLDPEQDLDEMKALVKQAARR
jgi:hypothetical protein